MYVYMCVCEYVYWAPRKWCRNPGKLTSEHQVGTPRTFWEDSELRRTELRRDGKCVDILREGHWALSVHQDSMSESDSKEKGNLKEERPKSSKASSKLHTKVEKEKETDQGKKEKETDQGKTKQKPSGLYLVLDEFADITLSDSAEDELDSEEEEDLEEAVAAYERERSSEERWQLSPSGTVARAPHQVIACRYKQLKLIAVVYGISIKCSTKIVNGKVFPSLKLDEEFKKASPADSLRLIEVP
ncbi:hypothetical protein STEG23_036440 [Scotinomys teguina]